MNLQDAIERNRRKWARWRKYEAMLRRIRLRVFDYEDSGQSEKAEQVVRRIKKILAPKWAAERKHR